MKMSITISLLLAALASSSALASNIPDCMHDSAKIEERLNAEMRKYDKKEPPALIILDDALDFSLGPNSRRSIFFEAFVRPETKYFRLIPGIGVGAELRKGTVFYACAKLDGEDLDNELFFHALEGPGVFTKRYDTKPLRLHWYAFSDGDFLLAGAFKLIGLDKIEKPIAGSLEKTFYALFDPIFGTGVVQLQIKPRYVTFWSSVVVAGHASPGAPTRVKFKSNWLLLKEE